MKVRTRKSAKKEETPASRRDARSDRLAQMQAVASDFDKGIFELADISLKPVLAVPTVLCQYDHATKVDGHPLERMVLVSGPSGHGKSKYSLAMIRSFLANDHYALMVDAERTMDRGWAALPGVLGPYLKHPGFRYGRPDTYERTVMGIRSWANTIANQRAKGRIAKDTTGIIVVDSIRKLVPEDMFARIMKEAKADSGKSERVGRDRAAQIKAAMNSAWMDEIIPLLEETQTCLVIIARETEDPDADQWAKRAGTNFKIGGGAALYYDASMVVRVERQKYVAKDRAENETGPATIYGERHRITIRKTKISGREDKQTVCYFHDSNGVLVPAGFDRARDVIDLAGRLGLAKTKGSWIQWGRHRWQGEHAAVKKLTATPELLGELDAELRASFKRSKPVEHDVDGVVE